MMYMQGITNGLLLYHGSYCEVPVPDLKKCAKQKDFGQGFYLTTSREQAVRFLNTAISKAKAIGIIDEKQQERQLMIQQTVCWLLTYREDMEKSELQTRILTV